MNTSLVLLKALRTKGWQREGSLKNTEFLEEHHGIVCFGKGKSPLQHERVTNKRSREVKLLG